MNNSDKSFGIVFSIFFLIISLYCIFNKQILYFFILFVLSVIFLILALFASKILGPLNIIWLKIGENLGKIITPIIMAIIYFIILTPIALCLKIFNFDLLRLKKNKNSFWIKKELKETNMDLQF